MQFDKNAWKIYSKYRFIFCCIVTVLGATGLILHLMNFMELDHWFFHILVGCIPFAIISLVYCGMSYHHERRNSLWFDDSGLYYSHNDGIYFSTSFTNYTVKEVSHYRETNRHFIVYGNIERSCPGLNDTRKKVEIAKIFSNMHLLREYLDRAV